MAFWDAIVRVLIGLILIYLGIEKGGAWILGEFLGFVLILTAVTTFCPLYTIAGVSSKGENLKET
ncbi:YgaP family membrane protein [Persephonella sp.]